MLKLLYVQLDQQNFFLWMFLIVQCKDWMDKALTDLFFLENIHVKKLVFLLCFWYAITFFPMK